MLGTGLYKVQEYLKEKLNFKNKFGSGEKLVYLFDEPKTFGHGKDERVIGRQRGQSCSNGILGPCSSSRPYRDNQGLYELLFK